MALGIVLDISSPGMGTTIFVEVPLKGEQAG